MPYILLHILFMYDLGLTTIFMYTLFYKWRYQVLGNGRLHNSANLLAEDNFKNATICKMLSKSITE